MSSPGVADWHFGAETVRTFCGATGALSRIHQSITDDGATHQPIVPGMLTFLLLEDLTRGLIAGPFHLDASFRKPIPIGSTVTTHMQPSPDTPGSWTVEVLLDGEIAVAGRAEPLLGS